MVLATFIAAALLSAAGAAPTPIPAPPTSVPALPSPLPAPSRSPFAGRPVATPSPAPLPSVAALTNDQMRKIDEIVVQSLQRQAVGGVSLAVVRNGRVVYSRPFLRELGLPTDR